MSCRTPPHKGNPGGAKLAAAGSLLIVLPAWALAALVLLLPACQNVLIGLFVYPSQADTPGPDDMALEGVLRRMFVIVAGLVLLDGIQTVMSGIIQVGWQGGAACREGRLGRERGSRVHPYQYSSCVCVERGHLGLIRCYGVAMCPCPLVSTTITRGWMAGRSARL